MPLVEQEKNLNFKNTETLAIIILIYSYKFAKCFSLFKIEESR